MKEKGIVYLVGAGPGNAGLLTLRGAELLKQADVVVYDALVNPEFLRLAPADAEIIYGGKRAKDHAIPQGDLNKLLVSKATEGKKVVRLKGGDPYVFGRGGEEAEELQAARIAFEVVPGISSAVAGPNYAGIPLTHRSYCSSFMVITGHEDPAKAETTIDWKQVAAFSGTKVVLMGAERIREIASSLVDAGMASDTPVAMVRWGTMGQQESIDGTLSSIADIAEARQFAAPAVTVIGDVVKLRDRLNWFEQRPLFGTRVVVTRSRDQASELSRRLIEQGADVVEIPTIKRVKPSSLEELKDAVLGLHEYDWVIFTSPAGVVSFFHYFFAAFDDLRDLGGVRIAAVGPATAAKLRELHLRVDLMPEEYVTSKILDAFTAYQSVENLRILIMRAEVANRELPMGLTKLGAIVDDVACYKTVAEDEDVTGSAARLLEEGAEWITFTSSSTVENFHARFDLPALVRRFPKLQLASIGPETSKAIRALGLEPAIEARSHTIPGLADALERAVLKS